MGNPASLFKNTELFQGLSEEDLEKILSQCHEISYPAGTVIFKEGQMADRFYMILEGRVEVWKDYTTPYSDILAIKGDGDSFGEMALIDDLPRSATIKTVVASRLLFLEKEKFHEIIQDNSTIAMVIMKSVSRMVRQSNETFIYGLRQKNQKLEAANEALKRAQDEALKNERLSTLGKFSSMIIHDLRNPISVIRGYAEMIQLCSGEKERIELMSGRLLGEADRLNRMVGELLDYSRGDIRLNLAPVLMDNFLKKLQEAQSPQLEAKKIKMEISCEVQEPVIFDADRIQRVLINLMDNSRKAMPKDGGKIGVSAKIQDQSLWITVWDTGEGMTTEVKQRIFEPFFSSSRAGGTGLGMLVVANVVEAHHGSIQVESELGQGTSVTLKIPLGLAISL